MCFRDGEGDIYRLVVIVLFFFFQAEDGIRDAQESRGLGDVYKRQVEVAAGVGVVHVLGESVDARGQFQGCVHAVSSSSVSYTHLTLPTIYSV